jgi:hypothetical protein
MKTYYSVMTEFYDNGTVKAAMASRVRKKKPNNQSWSTSIADCYIDCFEDKDEAERFLPEAKKEGAA